MANNSVYNDKRYLDQKADIDKGKKAELNEVDVTYGNMISGSQKFYDKQIASVEQYGKEQTKNQQAQSDLAIQKIEQTKEQAHKDYIKEQTGAYGDYLRQINPYGVEAEKMADAGLANSGYSEASRTNAYIAYQNRVATAREVYSRAVLNYDNSIAEARIQNNVLLAEIAYNTLQKSLELGLAGFQYKNTLLLEKAKEKRDINKTYHTYYQDVLDQINQENALAEEKRQADMANKRQQEQIEIAQAELKIQQEKWDAEKKAADNVVYTQKTQKSDNVSQYKSKKDAPSGTNSTKTTKTTTTRSTGTLKKTEQTNQNGNVMIDMKSVLDLGLGPISASKLNDLVSAGMVREYVSNGKRKFQWTSAGLKSQMTYSSVR